MANRYWVGGTASWDGTAGSKWSLTDGGAGGQAVPTSADDVFFTAASGAVTVTLGAAGNCKTLTMTGFTGTLAMGSNNILANGNIVLASGATYTASTGVFIFSTSGSMTTNGALIPVSMRPAAGQTLTMADAASVGLINFSSGGTFDQNGFNLTITGASYGNTGSTARTWTTNGGKIILSSTGAVTITFSGTNLTVTTPINFDVTGSLSTVTVASNQTIGNIRTFARSAMLLTTSFTAADLRMDAAGSALIPTAGVTITATSLTIGGSAAGSMQSVRSATLGSTATISISTGTITMAWLALQDMTFGGGATFVANNSADVNNNSGITINAPSGGGGSANLLHGKLG